MKKYAILFIPPILAILLALFSYLLVAFATFLAGCEASIAIILLLLFVLLIFLLIYLALGIFTIFFCIYALVAIIRSFIKPKSEKKDDNKTS